MKLLTKFNLYLSVVLLAGIIIAGFLSHSITKQNARAEILNHAGMMMEAALAIRTYTVKEIRPLLSEKMKQEFLPQSVPSYAATQNFNALRETHPEYIYKEATLNPTNPRDRAADWEADIIHEFRNNSTSSEIVGERNTPTGKSLYLARPIRIKNKGCLTCHSTVENAPETMIKLYGSANGFGWHFDEVVGAQVVSVPMAVAIKNADRAFYTFIGSLVAIFIAIYILINVMLRKIVITPVSRMTAIADEISKGNMQVPAFEDKGKDEISELTRSFNRMRVSLEKAMKMLDS